MTTDVVPLSVARRALAEADTLPDIRHLVDYAEAAKVAAKRAGLSEAAQRDWAVFSLEAQRKAGQLLAVLPKSGGARDGKRAATVAGRLREVLDAKTDAEAQHKSKRWQDVAAVPDAVFTDYLATAEELTRARLLRLGRDHTAEADRQAAAANARPAARDDIDIRAGDFREVLADLSDVDAIITDPPYPREYLPLLDDLAAFADRVLTPDGVLAVMMGQTHLPEVYRRLEGGRPYRWTMAYLTPAAGYASHARRVQSNWKPVIVYGAGPRFGDVVTSDGADKAHHEWGQDYTGTRALVERLTAPGAHVVDPFLGGGTTALACAATGRRFTGSDIDAAAVAATLRRLGEVPA